MILVCIVQAHSACDHGDKTPAQMSVIFPLVWTTSSHESRRVPNGDIMLVLRVEKGCKWEWKTDRQVA